MDPETLVTFAFRAPQNVRIVELLGSWDNFSRPYAMYHDRRRGNGFYTGCFQFENIIFDGSEVDWTKPRTGGLKQGGTYWYYFRLDDGVEAYDDFRECTAQCPLMPGQVVNVIHVPREITESPVIRRSASVNLVGTLSELSSLQTMNPHAKYETLEPPPVSKVHDRCISDFALSGRLEHQPPSPKEEPPSPPPSGEGLLKTGRRMFGSGVGSLSKRGMSLTGSLRSMAGRAAMRARVRHESTTYEASLIDEGNESASIRPARSSHNETSRPPTRRPAAENSLPEPEFQSFSQVIAIPTPSASPTKHLNDNDAASIGPKSICNIQFLGSSPDEPRHQPRRFSLHNPDDLIQAQPSQLAQQTPSEHSPALAVASPTFSDATISTLEGGEVGTPSTNDTLAAPYVDVRDEHLAAQLRWGYAMQNYDTEHQGYRLPDTVWNPKPSAVKHTGLAGEAGSRADAIFSELGYLGESIH